MAGRPGGLAAGRPVGLCGGRVRVVAGLLDVLGGRAAGSPGAPVPGMSVAGWGAVRAEGPSGLECCVSVCVGVYNMCFHVFACIRLGVSVWAVDLGLLWCVGFLDVDISVLFGRGPPCGCERGCW